MESSLYVKAENLKTIVRSKPIQESWVEHQQLTKTYKTLLVNHHQYALEKKIDQDLWNAFREPISELQKTKRSSKFDPKVVLDWFLEKAYGFYTVLAEEIKVSEAKDTGYIFQHISVHLGDIARYRNFNARAEKFYKEAIESNPEYGHAYNQIALLESIQGRVLSAVFYYVRSLCVTHPFPVASANLAKMLERIQGKKSDNSFLDNFLRFHAYLHQALSLKSKALKLCYQLNEGLTSLIATEVLTDIELIQMVVINLYQHSQCSGETEDELLIKKLVLESTAGLLNACLLPIYTMKVEDTHLDHFTLPAARIVLGWIVQNPEVLQESSFRRRLQIWPSLCRLLNELENGTESPNCHLPEDALIRSFSPLSKFDFENKSAKSRFLELGKLLVDKKVLALNSQGLFEPLEQDSCEDELAKLLLDSTSDESRESSPKTALSSPTSDSPRESKESKRINKNAAISSIMKKLGSEDKPKVSFQESEPVTSSRFVGLNGGQAQVRAGVQNFETKPDFSVPPPPVAQRPRQREEILSNNFGLGMIRPNNNNANHRNVWPQFSNGMLHRHPPPPIGGHRNQNMTQMPPRMPPSLPPTPSHQMQPQRSTDDYSLFSGLGIWSQQQLQPANPLMPPGPSALERFLQEQQSRSNCK